MSLISLGGYLLALALLVALAIVVYLKGKSTESMRQKMNRYLAERNEAVEHANQLRQQLDSVQGSQQTEVQKLQQQLGLWEEIVKVVLPPDKYEVVRYAYDQKVRKLR